MIVLSAMATETLESQGIIARWSRSEDRDYCQRRAFVRAQNESLLGRALLRALLRESVGADRYFFQQDGRGKLSVQGAPGGVSPDVSLSHSRGMVLAGVSLSGPLGVDIETHRPRAFAQLADFAFGPLERSRVREMGAGEFYRIWTLREAIAKATGEGLAMAADGADRIAEAGTYETWRQRFGLQDWLLGSFRLTSGISAAAACLLNAPPASTITTMQWVDLTGAA